MSHARILASADGSFRRELGGPPRVDTGSPHKLINANGEYADI